MLKILKNLDKKSIILIFLCFIFISLQVYLELKMPDYMSKITVLVQTEGSKMSEILQNGMWMMFCALGSLIVTTYHLPEASPLPLDMRYLLKISPALHSCCSSACHLAGASNKS